LWIFSRFVSASKFCWIIEPIATACRLCRIQPRTSWARPTPDRKNGSMRQRIDSVRLCLAGGSVSMQAASSEKAQTLYPMRLSEFHPRSSVSRLLSMLRYLASCCWCARGIAWRRSTAARYASGDPSWRLGSADVANSLIERNFGAGHPDDQSRDALTKNLAWRSGAFNACIGWVCPPTRRSGSSRERWLRRSHCDMTHPSVCERRSGPSPGQKSAGLHESKGLCLLPLNAVRFALALCQILLCQIPSG